MAKRVEQEAGEDTGRIPSKDQFTKIMRKANGFAKQMDDVREEAGLFVENAEASVSLHRAAFKRVRALAKLAPDNLAAYLAHFDAYREHAELDRLAGEDLLEPKAAAKARAKKAAEGTPKETKTARDKVVPITNHQEAERLSA